MYKGFKSRDSVCWIIIESSPLKYYNEYTRLKERHPLRSRQFAKLKLPHSLLTLLPLLASLKQASSSIHHSVCVPAACGWSVLLLLLLLLLLLQVWLSSPSQPGGNLAAERAEPGERLVCPSYRTACACPVGPASASTWREEINLPRIWCPGICAQKSARVPELTPKQRQRRG